MRDGSREGMASPPFMRRAIGFALACLLLGPPIGGLLIMAGLPVADAIASRGASLARLSLNEAGSYLLSSLVVGLVSFAFGALPALASAIWVGWRTYHHGRFGYGEAVIVATIATLMLSQFKFPASPDPKTWTLGILVLPASITAAIVLRWFLGRWMR